MNYYTASLAVLLAATVIVDVAGMPTTTVIQSTSTPGPNISATTTKLTLPTEWLRLSIRNESVIYTRVGSSFELVCEGTSSPPPTIKWYHDQTRISTEAGYPEKNDIGDVPLGRLTSRLRFNCITPQDNGPYYCTARTGSKVKTTTPVVIVVLEKDSDRIPVTPKTPAICEPDAPIPPRILVWGPTLLEFIGEDAVIPCVAVGNPTPKTRWVDHDGNPISTGPDSRFKRLGNGELFISRITWEDMGMYTCIAENEHGSDRTETFLYPARKSD